MRGFLVVLALVAALGACGSGSEAGTRQVTSLTVTYWPHGREGGDRERWTLRCNPARGTLANPGRACRRLAAGGTKLFTPVPRDVVCTQIYGGPQVARVTGTVAGRRISTTFNRSDGCEVGRWDGLSAWLLPPGGVT
jgi:Subtilisin inhibitor-like